MDPELVVGRACGSCNVCCVALTIDDPQLQKAQGYRCRNALPDNGCAIYETRPQTCRTFHCGYRRLKWVRDTLRPDSSGVLVRLHGERSEQTGSASLGVMVTLLHEAALDADGLAETIAAGIMANIPVYLHIPGPPGYTASTARINQYLAHAVVTRNKPLLLQLLREARAKGLGGKRRRIVMNRPPSSGGPTVTH